MLSKEEDFQQVKSVLQERMEEMNCRVIYGVKFHPEFMMVESCYRYKCNGVYILNVYNRCVYYCDFRDVSLYMKTRNIIGCSKGYVNRVLDSDSSVTPENVQKYFLNTLKYMKLYMEVSP